MQSDPENTPLIGPGGLQDEPSMLIEEARQRLRQDDERNTEGRKLARRLLVAFILIAILGIVFYIVLPHYGVYMPPILPVISFIAILVGTVMTAIEEARDNDELDDPDAPTNPHNPQGPNGCCNTDEGRPFGCCQGPRPLRMFKDKKPKR